MNYLELAGTLVGLVYLWLEYKASIYLWIASIIMPAIYIFVYYRAGLYADFGINIYYLLASLYGWFTWRLRKPAAEAETSQQDDSGITHLPLRYLLPLLVLFGILFTGIGIVLIRWTDSTVPWLDSFTTALSIIALWMLARKYVEQWLAWIAVDAVCCGLYFYKDLYFTAILYGFYTVIAIFGFLKWKQLITQQNNENKHH